MKAHRMLVLVIFAGVSATAGCATFNATPQQLSSRATADLSCSSDQLEITHIDDRTRSVKGCGKRATYVEQCRPCHNGYVGCDCTWILNSDVTSAPESAAPPEPSAPAAAAGVTPVTLERADWVPTWTAYEKGESSYGTIYSPTDSAELLVMPKAEYERWVKGRGEPWEGSLGSIGMIEDLPASGPLEVPLRSFVVFRVDDTKVREIRFAGESAEAYWGVDVSDRNPSTRGGPPYSDLHLVGRRAGTSWLEVVGPDGTTRSYEVVVGK